MSILFHGISLSIFAEKTRQESFGGISWNASIGKEYYYEIPVDLKNIISIHIYDTVKCDFPTY